MLTLTNLQKRHLKALAHARKPIVIIGDKGLTPAVLHEILQVLDHHELVKIRVNAADRPARDAMIEDICTTSGALLVQRVGHIATLFRRNPEAPRIVGLEPTSPRGRKILSLVCIPFHHTSGYWGKLLWLG